jgi:hypothetical protein
VFASLFGVGAGVKAEIAEKGSHSRSRAAKIAKAERDPNPASDIDR